MNIIIHADDFGISKGITDNIIDCVENGCLTSISIVPNGYAFDYAINEFKKCRNLRLAVHLNFLEGKSLSPQNKVDLLVNECGQFSNSFVSLWTKYVFGTPEIRKRLKYQIQIETSAQIERVCEHIGTKFPINIDSHQHLHMIPFIFESLLSIKKNFNIEYIRIPDEPYFIHYDSISPIINNLSPNLIKWILLKMLSRKKKSILSNMGIHYPDYFIGVLFTGRMTLAVVKNALATVKRLMPSKNTTVEVLFHPGGADENEFALWDNYRSFRRYYFSSRRHKELETLKSDNLKQILEKIKMGV